MTHAPAGLGVDALPLPGMPELVRIAAGVGDRIVLTPATPAWLATITTCCVCGATLPAGSRYLCAGPGCRDAIKREQERKAMTT